MLSAAISAEPWSSLELDTLSSVTSLPGAPRQHWHRDTSAQLLQGEEAALSRLPAHCFTLFVPLKDVAREQGPTELLLGSHLGCASAERTSLRIPDAERGGSWNIEGECAHTIGRPWEATAEAGAAILFDSRLMHRGGANRSPRRRPQIYMTYARGWFTDRVNFLESQTRELAAYPPKMQRLLSRVDAREYVWQTAHEMHAHAVHLAPGAPLMAHPVHHVWRRYVALLEERLEGLGVDPSTLGWKRDPSSELQRGGA